ncbi:MAG: hypothetical protein HOK06_03890 [Rhodospirillaceae bacterium]|jgi:hypothetical protein|nr:hypothetical protein [Rhodospirillaceae bacterium]MBT4218587.1 hypothetical protein [Rhodospirillaceae bacterium]MBT4464505.1 hypothetical protein [Rhodospirillaceae bacterium]MBT5012880.1 hypothetical protein [Rhodospirillaceae bacterium]MBT5307888.1 hypothetical protein [Rhodospirillaceae bacterium]
MTIRMIITAVMALSLAGCASEGKKIVIPKLAPAVQVAKVTEVRVEQVSGPAVPMAKLLTTSVVEGLREHDVVATEKKDDISLYVLNGRAEANWTDTRVPFVMLIYWTLKDIAGNQVGTYTQGIRGARWKWEYGDPLIIRAVGRGAAKPISSMIAEEETPSLPVLLMGAGMLVNQVQGAPGSGNKALTAAIKSALGKLDVLITDDKRQAKVQLSGTVTVQAQGNDRDRVGIVWLVTTPDGFEVGRATQENTVPSGSLDGDWDEQAGRIASAAVAGIERILGLGGGKGRRTPGIGGAPPLLDLPTLPGRAPPPPG